MYKRWQATGLVVLLGEVEKRVFRLSNVRETELPKWVTVKVLIHEIHYASQLTSTGKYTGGDGRVAGGART
jgi:hypothetical protein